MSLDTSKLNLQGVGTLKSNASMVSGVDPGRTFNLTIKADDTNHNWSSTTTTLSNITSISGTSTFTIKSNPGFQVHSSMFTYSDIFGDGTLNTYYYDLTFSNTLSNVDPLNEVEVTVHWRQQSISSDIDIIILNIATGEELDGNVYHKNEIIIDNPNSNYYQLTITPYENVQVNDNICDALIIPGEEKQLFEISLVIKEEFRHLVAFNNLGIIFNTFTGAEISNYSIEYTNSEFASENPFTVREFIVSFTPELDYFNSFNYSDIIILNPITVQPSIYVNESFAVFEAIGDTNSQSYTINLTRNYTKLRNFAAYKAHHLPPWPATDEQANWIQFNNSSYDPIADTLSFTVSNQPSTGAELRRAYIYLWNTINSSDFSKALNSIAVVQASGDTLEVSLINATSDYQGILGDDNLSVTKIHQDGGVLNYQAVINSEDNWVYVDSPPLNDFITFSVDSSTILDGQSTSVNWLEDSMTVSQDATFSNILNFAFNIPSNPDSAIRAVNVLVQRPNSTLTVEFTLSQKRAWNYNVDDFTLYTGDQSNYVEEGNYFDLPLNNEIYEVAHENVSGIFFGIQLSDFDIGLLSSTDFTITIDDSSDITDFAFLDITDTHDTTQVPYDFLWALYVPNNTTFNNRVGMINIKHPYYGNSDPAKTITISQEASPAAFFVNPGGFYITPEFLYQDVDLGNIESSVFQYHEIENGGTITTSIFSSEGNTPVLALVGCKEFSYPEGNMQPVWNATNEQNLDYSWISGMAWESGYSSFGITEAPTITMSPTDTASNGTIQFTFNDSDQEGVYQHHTYRQWFFYLYPSGTEFTGNDSQSNGLITPVTNNDVLPSALIVTQRVNFVVEDSLKFNGIMTTTTPFNFGQSLTHLPILSASGGISPLILVDSGLTNPTDYLQPSVGIPQIILNESGAAGIGDSFQFTANPAVTLDDLSYNAVDCIVGFNKSHADLEIYFSDISPVYQVFGGNNNADLGNISAAVHNSNPQGVTLPEATIHSDGAALGYPIGFENYIKFHIPSVPNTYIIDSVTHSVSWITFKLRFHVGISSWYLRVQRRPHSADYITQGPAVFLLAGQSNMVGRDDDDGVSYPIQFSGIKQYKYTTYNADNTDTTLHDASSPLDHVDENAGDMGLAKNFVIKLRENNLYDNRQIILIPTAEGGTGFTDDKWGVGQVRYTTAVNMVNVLMASLADDATFEGILWHQGEKDYQNNDFIKDFYYMAQKMRHDINAADSTTPFVIGDLIEGGDNTNTWTSFVHQSFVDLFYRVKKCTTTSLSAIGGGDNVHFSTASLNSLGEKYYNEFLNLKSYLSPDAYPNISSWGNSSLQWIFGLDNQLMIPVDSDGEWDVDNAMTFSCFSPSASLQANPFLSAGNPVTQSDPGITYDTFTYNNTATHVKQNISHVNILNDLFFHGLNTGIPDQQELTFAIVFKAQGYNASASDRHSIIFGNFTVEYQTQMSADLPDPHQFGVAYTPPNLYSSYGFGLFTNATGQVRIMCRSGIAGESVSTTLIDQPVADKWYFVVLEATPEGVTARYQYTMNAMFDPKHANPAGGRGVAMLEEDTHHSNIYLGNQLYASATFEGGPPTQIAYFAAALNGASGGINYGKWCQDVAHIMGARGITID